MDLDALTLKDKQDLLKISIQEGDDEVVSFLGPRVEAELAAKAETLRAAGRSSQAEVYAKAAREIKDQVTAGIADAVARAGTITDPVTGHSTGYIQGDARAARAARAVAPAGDPYWDYYDRRGGWSHMLPGDTDPRDIAPQDALFDDALSTRDADAFVDSQALRAAVRKEHPKAVEARAMRAAAAQVPPEAAKSLIAQADGLDAKIEADVRAWAREVEGPRARPGMSSEWGEFYDYYAKSRGRRGVLNASLSPAATRRLLKYAKRGLKVAGASTPLGLAGVAAGELTERLAIQQFDAALVDPGHPWHEEAKSLLDTLSAPLVGPPETYINRSSGLTRVLQSGEEVDPLWEAAGPTPLRSSPRQAPQK